MSSDNLLKLLLPENQKQKTDTIQFVNYKRF